MKIENESCAADKLESIRKIQEYQEQQQAQLRADQQQAERARVEQESQVQAQVQGRPDPTEIEPDHARLADDLDGARQATAAQDLQAQIQNRQVAQVSEAREASGAERSDEAVEIASVQQDRAEAWQSFAGKENHDVIPPSLEDQAAQAREDARGEQQRINMRDLMNQMAIQSGKINA